MDIGVGGFSDNSVLKFDFLNQLALLLFVLRS